MEIARGAGDNKCSYSCCVHLAKFDPDQNHSGDYPIPSNSTSNSGSHRLTACGDRPNRELASPITHQSGSPGRRARCESDHDAHSGQTGTDLLPGPEKSLCARISHSRKRPDCALRWSLSGLEFRHGSVQCGDRLVHPGGQMQDDLPDRVAVRHRFAASHFRSYVSK